MNMSPTRQMSGDKEKCMAIDFAARRERFKQSNANRAAAAQGNFGGYDRRDPVDYVSMEIVKTSMRAGRQVVDGKPLQLRFVGSLDESNPRMPGDMKRLSVADIKYFEKVDTLDDLLAAQADSKSARRYTQIIFPDKEDRKSHPLWKLLDTVLAYTWNETLKRRDYHHTDDDLFPVFRELRYNGDPSNQMEQGWQPGDAYMMNCIDRAQMAWHRENKRTLVLSRGSWMSKDKEGNEVQRFSTGTKKTVYDGLCNKLNETYGFHEEFDVITWRVPDKPHYEIVHAKHGFEAPFWAKAGFERFDEYLEQPLTEEELSWALWDFDKLFKPTADDRIFNRLGYMFKIYDEFQVAKGKKSSLWDEMKAMAEEAKAARAEEQKNMVAGSGDVDDDGAAPADDTSAVAVSTTQPVAQRTVASRPADSVAASSDIPWQGLADGTFNGTKYAGVPLLTDDERAHIIKVNADGSFQYVATHNGKPVVTGACTQSGFFSPMDFHVDPLSGLIF